MVVGLASPKPIGQCSRLEIQGRADIVVLNSKSVGQANRQETQVSFDITVLRQNCCFALKVFY